MIQWRQSHDGFISTQNGGIEMEIDGAVLCHIMNLYSISRNPMRYWRRNPAPILNQSDDQLCKFQSGTVAWKETNGQIHAHFEPGIDAELNAEKVPFGDLGSLFERNTWLQPTSQLSCMEYQILI